VSAWPVSWVLTAGTPTVEEALTDHSAIHMALALSSLSMHLGSAIATLDGQAHCVRNILCMTI
jgi:hypothetical protein